MTTPRWEITEGPGPVVTTAIHAGHELRAEVAALAALSDAERLREEDPHTDAWLWVARPSIAVSMSRFEVDLNRPRDAAVYRRPEDAWGLQLWRDELPDDVVARSLEHYDSFYDRLGTLLDGMARAHRRFVVLDLHSYNHRRGGPTAPVDDPEANPEVNVGTGSVDRSIWGDVVDAFSDALSRYPLDGGHLDVRENVRFQGGHMSRWINARYPGVGCCLAIEVKKFYMDEWTGAPDESVIVNVGEALSAAAAAVEETIAG